MIRDLVKNVNDYTTAMKQSMEVKGQAVDFIKANYMPQSVVYDEAMKQCAATFDEAVRPLKKTYREAVEKEIEETKKRIADVITSEIPDEVTKILPMVESMTDFEKQTILDKYSKNYLAQKMLHQAMHNDKFRTVESIVSDISDLETELNKVVHSGIDSYTTKLMQNGKWIDNVSDEVQGFIDKYTVQKEGEK